ncbi:MAG: ABC transporter permease [Anaerolineae bacterium]
MTLQRLLRRNEFLVFLTIIALSILITLINPSYLSLANIFRMLRSSTELGIFALGVLIVLISGGIDVSFPAIAIFALYSTVRIVNGLEIEPALIEAFSASMPEATAIGWGQLVTVLICFLIGGSIGFLLGMINAVFIALLRLPTLIVTLGTLNMFRGFLLFFIGSVIIRDIPDGLKQVARVNIVSIRPEQGLPANLNIAIVVLVFFAVLVWWMLRYTMLGRGIYALGGDREAAARAGFNIRQIQFFIYGFVGFLAGIGGIVSGGLTRQADPFSIVGTELDVIAAVVLGGASIAGGRGTVVGTLLGVALITIVSQSLVLVGIPSDWQKVVIGVLIIIGVGVPAIQNRRTAAQLNPVTT